MRQQLYKRGLRRCWGCKKVKHLNKTNFAKGDKAGFITLCKVCDKRRKQTPEYKEKMRLYRQRPEVRARVGYRALKLRFSILQDCNFTCQYCGRSAPTVELQIDHKFPKSRGGKNTRENFTVACKDCNLGKSDVVLT